MKKIILLWWVVCVCLQLTSAAQSISKMQLGMYPETKMATEDAFNRRGRLYNNAYYVIIDGQKVMGTTFWDPSWLAGSLIAGDGRIVDAFKFRYDAYYQAIYFLNGADSLEVNEPVREFTLKQPDGDSIASVRFINGNQLNRAGKPVYYQVMADGAKGQLLKLNQLVISETAEGVPVSEGKKALIPADTYHYYDKSKKKLTKLKPQNTNILAAMNIKEADLSDIRINDYDLAHEKELVALVKKILSLQ